MRKYDDISIFFKMAAAEAQYYFCFPVCWFHCLQKVKIYQQTKFRRHISIHGWNVTTSVSEKQTSAILEFYFRFRFWLHHRSRHVILHQDTQSHPNRTTDCGNITSYPFFKMAGNSYANDFGILWQSCARNIVKIRQYLWKLRRKNQWHLFMWTRCIYLNSQLRYNYFRFGKTNVRYIGLLLPVSFSTISPKSACHCASDCSAFPSVDVAVFRRSKAVCKPTFVDIAQFMAEI